MLRYIAKSFWLLFFSVVICCILYPLVLWAIGQVAFPFQANGSLLMGPDGKQVGSRLIAQPFTKDEYFNPAHLRLPTMRRHRHHHPWLLPTTPCAIVSPARWVRL